MRALVIPVAGEGDRVTDVTAGVVLKEKCSARLLLTDLNRHPLMAMVILRELDCTTKSTPALLRFWGAVKSE